MSEYEAQVRQNGARIAARLRRFADAIEACEVGVRMEFSGPPREITAEDLAREASEDEMVGTLTLEMWKP